MIHEAVPVKTLSSATVCGLAGGSPPCLPDVPVSDLYPERVVAIKLDPGLVHGQPVEPAHLLWPQLTHLIMLPGLGTLTW